MLLSLLIPTMTSRQAFAELCETLQLQVRASRWASEVEILVELDSGK
jgi:hypothetical protein